MISRIQLKTFIFILCLSAWQQATAAEAFTVEDIRVEGLQRIAVGTVFNYIPVKVGERIEPGKTAEIIRALFKTGFFKDVKLEREGDVLIVFVVERPAVGKIKLEGNKDIETENLLQALKDIGLAEGRVFDRSILDKIELELQRQYFSRGKYGVKIKSTVTPLERNRVAVNIDIAEGVAARIKRINIIGNQAFEEDELLDQFELGIPGFFSLFSTSDQYSKQKLSGDLETLRSYYLDRGYLKFDIESTQVSITPDKKDIYITIVVAEGAVYTIEDIKLAGKMVAPLDEILPKVQMSRGEVFSRKKVTSSAERISQVLGNHGYAFANVNSIPELDEENKKVTITFFTDPGKRVYVNRVNMQGNTRTRDEVLRREMQQMEAGWFSAGEVQKSRNRLERLGYFEEVNIETPAVPGTADQVDVNVKVKEKPSGNLMAGIGFSQSQGLIFNASISENNFLGTGKRVSIAFNNSSANTLYRLAYTNPYWTMDGISRGYNLSYRSTDFSELDTADYVTDEGNAGITFGVPVTELDRINFGLAYNYTDFTPGTSTVAQDFAVRNGTKFHDFPVTVSWHRDSRNRAFFATSGGVQSLSAMVTLPGSDLLFYRISYNNQRFFPLTRDYTLMLNGDIGYGDSFSSTERLPFFRNFFAGGPRSVRGFKENTLGPRESGGTNDPIGGNLQLIGNLELIFPSPWEDFSKTLRISAFFDIGTVFDLDKSFGAPGFDFSEMRYSAGLAASWLSPVGALTVSFAQPLNDKPEDEIERFQFTFGTTF